MIIRRVYFIVRTVLAVLCVSPVAWAGSEAGVQVGSVAAFQLSSSAFVDGGYFPYQYSYCQPSAGGKRVAAQDLSPPLRWSGAPANTRSFVLIVSDIDAPVQVPTDQPIAIDTARRVGYHWVLVNIPSTLTALPEGVGSKGFVAGGKQPGKTPFGIAGLNLYHSILNAPESDALQFEKNKVYAGVYGQYDGPCPPWNDLKSHRYVFALYALDVADLGVPDTGMFTAPEVLKLMRGHVLAKTSLTLTYSIVPATHNAVSH